MTNYGGVVAATVVVRESRINWRNVIPEIQSKYPTETICSNCRQLVVTIPQKILGHEQEVFGVLIALTVVGLPFCWIPCVIPAWSDVLHFCPNCKLSIGLYKHRICCGC